MRITWLGVFLVVLLVSAAPWFLAKKSSKVQRTADQPIPASKLPAAPKPVPQPTLLLRCKIESEVWSQVASVSSPQLADRRVREWRRRGGNCDWDKIIWE